VSMAMESSEEGIRKSCLGLKPNGGFHKLSYIEWGDVNNNKIILCIHGRCPNALCFKGFAKQFSKQYRVIALDLIGHGCSDWISKTPEYYCYEQYIKDVNVWFASILNGKDVTDEDLDLTLIGISLGGLISMLICSLSKHPIKRLILDDIGPSLSKNFVDPVNEQTSKNDWRAATKNDMKLLLKDKFAARFGPTMTDKDWDNMVEYNVECRVDEKEETMCRFNYDPLANVQPLEIWKEWEQIKIPILVIHGLTSPVLTDDMVKEMIKLNPNTIVYDVKDTGHCPPIDTKDIMKEIEDFINNN